MAHWISGGTSGSASFTAGWLKPQVRQMNTTSTMLAASSGRVWLAGGHRSRWLNTLASCSAPPVPQSPIKRDMLFRDHCVIHAWQCAQTPEISITGAFGVNPAARAADLS